jgi:uncharacterized membrane protein YeaQ/YmgE (transglycosylase-associated protein family)
MLSILVWLVFGFIAGSVAEWLWPPAKPHSRFQTIGIGIAGSVCGGLVGSILTGSYYAPAGFALSVAGAVLCNYVCHMLEEVKP